MDYIETQKLQNFFSKHELITFDKHENIVHDGTELPEYFYFIKTGYVKTYLLTNTGDILSLNLSGPGTTVPVIVNIINIQSSLNNSLGLESVTKVEAYRVLRSELQSYFMENMEVYYENLKKSNLEVDFFISRLPNLIYGNAKERVIDLLLYLSQTFTVKENGHLLVVVPLRHRDIASFVGISREVVTTNLNKLKKKNIIGYHDGYIKILDLEKLQKLASPRQG